MHQGSCFAMLNTSLFNWIIKIEKQITTQKDLDHCYDAANKNWA